MPTVGFTAQFQIGPACCVRCVRLGYCSRGNRLGRKISNVQDGYVGVPETDFGFQVGWYFRYGIPFTLLVDELVHISGKEARDTRGTWK